ncbi:MAG: glycosyltransferase family 2 protein [Pacificimonas sp.]
MTAVTVLMAVRDGAAFLEPALETLREQTLGDFEFLVVDDGSTDETPQILSAKAAADPRLKIIRKDGPGNLAASLNLGLRHADTELVARADADDLYEPERLATQVAEMHARPSLGVLSCGFRRIDAKDRVLSVNPPIIGVDQIRFELLFHNCILHPGTIFRKAVVMDVDGYDERYWRAQDTDLWTRLRTKTEIDNQPDILVSYREHSAAVTQLKFRDGDNFIEDISIRALRPYTGGALDDDTLRAGNRLYGSRYRTTLSAADIQAGLTALSHVCRTAKRREPKHIYDRFRKAVAKALLHQAELQDADGRRDVARKCSAQAFRWAPGPFAARRYASTFGKSRNAAALR